MVPSIKMRRLSRRIRVRRVCYALIYYAVFAVSVFGYAERNGIDLLAAFHNWKQIKYSPYFSVGDRVHHYAALPFPEKIDKSADTQKFCLKCGSTHFPEQSRCYYCGKPLPEASDEQATEKKKMSFHDIFG